MKHIKILNWRIDNVTMSEALKKAEEFILNKKPHMCVTFGLDCFWKAEEDLILHKAIDSADLVVPDAMGIVWLSKIFGTPLKERVTGLDLTIKLCELSAKRGYKLYLLGSTEETLAKTLKIMKDKYGAKIVGTYSPPFGLWDKVEEKMFKDINEKSPEVLLVATGVGKGEKWLYKNLGRLNVPFCMQIGRTFEAICGNQKRAPLWMQKIGMEGIYFILHHPWRLREAIKSWKFVLSRLWSKDQTIKKFGGDLLNVAYIVSMRNGLSSFTYREIVGLINNGLKITIFPTKYYTGPYMPNDENMDTYLYNPVYTMLKQLFFFMVLSPARYLKLANIAIRTKSLIDFLIGTDFAYQIKKRKIDRIHCEFGDHKLFIGYYCKELLDLPLTVTIHAHELYVNPNRDMFRKSLKACDKIITISGWNKNILVNKFKVSEEKIIVNRLFVDTEKFKPDNSIKILIVSAFEKRKGHDALFKAIKKLNRNDIKVWVVGGGERIPDADRSYPEIFAKELQIDDKVVFFGKVSEEVLKTLYNLCDIFVLPSKTSDRGQKEGIPVSLMEAMAFGKPVISTRHAGIPELVEEILVEENNVGELAKAIEALADNPKLREKLGKRNREIIEKKYSKKNVDKLKKVLLGGM